jgi:alpha-tubulin suppressor-like RCC1 family protein
LALFITLSALSPTAESADAQQHGRAQARATPDTLVALSAGSTTTCATTSSGTGYCWGHLGQRYGKVYRILDVNGRLARLRSTSPGWVTLCAQTIDGEAACDPSLTGASTDSTGKWKRIPSCADFLCVLSLPKYGAMPAGPVRAVDAGWMHACALALDGSAFCWGRNDQGQLGNGSWVVDSTGSAGEIVRAPTAVATEYRFATLSAGENTTCGITEPGAAIYCWGYGQSGQTGDSSVMTTCSGEKPYYSKPCSNAVPTRVRVETWAGVRTGADVRFAQVSVGMRLACALSVGGDVYCWGNNYRCALGRCRESDSPLAHRIQLSGRAAEISAGYRHACARTLDRRIFCWGQNTEGQLGSLVSVNLGTDGLPPDYRDTTNRKAQARSYNDDPCFLGGRCSPAPVEVSPGRRWSRLAVGSDHACALAEGDGGIYCWGGLDTAAIGLGARLVPCINRSRQWKDVRCQVEPVRVPGLPRLTARVIEQEPSTATPPARVTVSRREVRVVFPPDDGKAWGWSALADPNYRPWYDWGISVDGMDGLRSLRLMAGRANDSARRFVSLDSLVAAGRLSLCSPTTIRGCSPRSAFASVVDGRVVLVLRDSVEIARLFGLRPLSVTAWTSRPPDGASARMDSTPVWYVAPQIAPVTAAVLADARASRRRYEASIRTISRTISTDHNEAARTALWLAVGDSSPLSVVEEDCIYDSCRAGIVALADSLWALGDSSVAGLRVAASSRTILQMTGPSMQLVGRRPGRTRLDVTLPPLPSDTAPSRSPPQRALTRELVVTRPMTRIAFVPRPDSLRVGESIVLRVRGTDDQGRQYENVPARIMVNDGERGYTTSSADPVRLQFGSPGTRTIVSQYRALSDTLTVRVVPVR